MAKRIINPSRITANRYMIETKKPAFKSGLFGKKKPTADYLSWLETRVLKTID